MRKRNIKRAVPLDVVPERRSKRCSPRFWPGDRFCGLSFRYLSPGSEEEKCRLLDHVTDPFHSLSNSNFYISVTVLCYIGFLHLVPLNVSWYVQIFQLRMCSCTNTHFKVQSNQLSPGLLHMVRADAYWHIIGSIYACAFAGEMKLFINWCRPISFSSFSCLCFVLLLVCLFAFLFPKQAFPFQILYSLMLM